MADQVKTTIIEPDGKEHIRWTPKGKSVWEALEMLGWDTGGACGGQGTCGKCKFRMQGSISPLTSAERDHLIPEEIKTGHRLACLARIEGDFTLFIDFWAKEGTSKGDLLKYQPVHYADTPITTRSFYIEGRLQDSHTPLYDRIKAALPDYRLQISMSNLNELAGLDRPGRPALELHALIMDGKRVPYIARQKEAVYGLALDIGTTSLFAALVEMQTGIVTAMASTSNMQRTYGEDIITRISYANEQPDGVSVLHKILINNLNSMIEEMLEQSGADQHKIYRVAAVGNPVMLHLLLGLGVSDLGRAPYVGTFSQTVETQAGELGLRVNPLAQLFTLPQLGGFVGADTTACLMTLANAAEATYLMIDIGTNGEIVLNNRGRMWAASAAAGPAFEGGAISCGMRAGQGAIDKVTVVDGELKLRVIGGGSPRGICGSGLIDLVACLLQYQDLDRNGNISESPHLNIPVGKGKRGREIILQPAGQTITGLALVLDQEDIRQLQLARSAVRTAVEILMVQAGVEAGQVEKVYLAGAFGNYLDPASILQIGLIPSIEAVKIRNIGNAAAEGAIMALLSQKQCELADNIRTRVQYVELADQPDFQNRFIKNIDF